MFVVVTILCNYHDSIIIEIIIAIVAFPLSPGLALGTSVSALELYLLQHLGLGLGKHHTT